MLFKGTKFHHICIATNDSVVLGVARSSSRFYMATITSYEVPKHLAYPVDADFIGVTPHFENSDADVE